MPKPKLLLITTAKDFSLDLFFRPESTALIEPFYISYTPQKQELDKLEDNFEYVYFRDPFNDSNISQDLAQQTTSAILNRYETAYKVDGINSYEDMYFEDKWEQYKLLSNLMPSTELLQSLDQFDQQKQIIKKRISARSKDIIFNQKDFPPDAKLEDYIVQPKLDVETEYRAYMVGGKIVQPLAIKSSKSINQKVKLTGVKESTYPEITKICDAAYETTHYDLIGLDIVKTEKEFVLIEVNRSCQLRAYLRVSHLNLASSLNSFLLTKPLT